MIEGYVFSVVSLPYCQVAKFWSLVPLTKPFQNASTLIRKKHCRPHLVGTFLIQALNGRSSKDKTKGSFNLITNVN